MKLAEAPIAPERRSSPTARRPRIVLYSHDTMGLGHVRRNMLLAHALAGPPLQASVLMIAGTRAASVEALPESVDLLTLPGLRKDVDGKYASRHLELELGEALRLRGAAIRAALGELHPDLLIVDNVPRGAGGELDETLALLQARGTTRLVLGLRDVLDEPAAVRDEWARRKNAQVVGELYDAVWVYGDRRVYDTVAEYRPLLDAARDVQHVGYLDQRVRLGSAAAARTTELLEELELPEGPLALCLVGGGQDGARLAKDFAFAELPVDTSAVLVAGPFMPASDRLELQRASATRPRLGVLDAVPEPAALLDRADRVVSMGGYNTSCEILSFAKRSLVVPRVRPRREQAIRAERLQALGLVDVLSPERLTPRALTRWLAAEQPAATDRWEVDLNGLARVPQLAAELLDRPAPARAAA